MNVLPIRTRVFQENDDLFGFITEQITDLPEQSVLVVTSKIVALAEGRTAIVRDDAMKARLIRSESEFAILTKYVWLTIKDGQVMPSAGIDESNANGKLILLPRDSYLTAHDLRLKLCRHYQIKNLGVLLTDSRTIPLRAGVAGVSLGYAGFCGIKDYRNTPDLFGRKFHFSRTDIADSLAAAAVLVMGEGTEQQPLAIIRDAPIVFRDKVDRDELRIDIEEDMYRPLFTQLPKQ